MPLVDLSMVEQRYDAVREVLDGATVKDTALRYGVYVSTEGEPQPRKKVVGRRVDHAGRISIPKHRYHAGRHLAGEAVIIESADGLLHETPCRSPLTALCSLRGVSSYWQSLPPVLKLAVILAAGISIAAIGYFMVTLIFIALGGLGVGGS